MRIKYFNFSGQFLLGLLSIYATSLHCEEANMPHFEAMVGEGNLSITTPSKDTSVEKAILKKKMKRVVFGGVTFSQFISLENESETIIAVAYKSEAGLLCPGGIEECLSKYTTPTKQEGTNKLITHSTFSRRQYIVELYEDKFIYRVQYKNCFIGYPHGCLIYGFGWHDMYTYEFKR